MISNIRKELGINLILVALCCFFYFYAGVFVNNIILYIGFSVNTALIFLIIATRTDEITKKIEYKINNG